MKNAKPVKIFLQDYREPDFLLNKVNLYFQLFETHVEVQAQLEFRCCPDRENPGFIRLDGEGLELLSLKLNGDLLAVSQYEVDDQSLTVRNVPESFTLESRVRIYPHQNTALEGLYVSSGNFCTQCEAQGFRKITYFPDRPDVMTIFTTTIEAEAACYPYLLSNGNDVARGQVEDGRHWVRWEDPHRKPSYLFALVAGDFALNESAFTTASGREVALRIYTEHHNADKTDHAMRSLKRAMRWDEEQYGLEYDLDIYMIVAVDDFNMGAMENKGLNVFNSKFVLARPDTATDHDYINIEAVIAHEYFHNWTGNRVTCRDWFQLSLKEGLTVYRDQRFTADMTSAAVKRIDDVRALRTYQFAEDASPMAHPIRPSSYMEINNFYTLTVYEKGAEVVRMYETLLGREGFRKGMDLYFERHDGQAVTTEDFLHAMADANDFDLSQFQLWYEQAGTPEIEASGQWNANEKTWTLTLSQHCPPTPENHEKAPFLIPVRVALFNATGEPMPFELKEKDQCLQDVLLLSQEKQQFTFTGLNSEPIPSLLRGFSAPVKLHYDYDDQALRTLAGHDTDAFNRWNAIQTIYEQAILENLSPSSAAAGHIAAWQETVIPVISGLLQQATEDRLLTAEALTLPAEGYLAEMMEVIDVDAIFQTRMALKRLTGEVRYDELLEVYQHNCDSGAYALDNQSLGQRRLKSVTLDYLMASGSEEAGAIVFEQFQSANNMTDSMNALQLLTYYGSSHAEAALGAFYDRWQDDALVLDKWFAVQASAPGQDTLESVKKLMEHPKFCIKTPNRVRALIGAFVQANPTQFHAPDGSGYRFAADQIITLDVLNPQVASRLSKAFARWQRYDMQRQGLMKKELERISAVSGLSSDVYEVVSNSLNGS
ncbi:MAG: aminopeptidase N [Thiotrichales bacterium]